MDEYDDDVIEDTAETDETMLDESIETSDVGDTANVGETSVEIDVEELVAELEAEGISDVDCNGKVRKRLEEILEQKRAMEELADFDDYDV